MKTKLTLGAIIGSAFLALSAGNANATIRNYPGSAPCNTSFQACIDGSQPGDTIQLGPASIDEDFTINKSLTLKPIPGNPAATIGGGMFLRVVRIENNPAGDSMDVKFHQLAFWNARISAGFTMGAGHHLAISNCSMYLDSGTSTIPIAAAMQVEATIEILQNSLNVTGKAISIHGNSLVPFESVARIRGNRITTPTGANSVNGISLHSEGKATIYAKVQNNVLFNGIGGAAIAGAGGIKLLAGGDSFLNAKIENNTLHALGSGAGIFISPLQGSGSIYATIVNTIISNGTGMPVFFPAAQQGLSVSLNYSNIFGNGLPANYGGYPPDIFMHSQDPDYINPAGSNFNLSLFSPMANAGTNDNGGGTLHIDTDLKPRIISNQVDIGAYERSLSLVSPPIKFNDNFNNLAINSDYLYVNGTWTEDARNLVSTGAKAQMLIQPENLEMTNGAFETVVRISGEETPGVAVKFSFFIWYKDKANYVELMAKEGTDKWILKYKKNGVLVAKEARADKIDPEVNYHLKVFRAGNLLTALIDNRLYLTIETTDTLVGTAGFKVKGTTAYIDNLLTH